VAAPAAAGTADLSQFGFDLPHGTFGDGRDEVSKIFSIRARSSSLSLPARAAYSPIASRTTRL